ncbi:hypothetical protein AC579_8974 [Pseudocercospora musae]|uniref:Uncharacterized protein n=1 Tax=Pseudocercospora musae TaxID=113226 RepID=A0A139HP07_9PEZI|nr:hypothetical protein AC579_8974 [Pseudocercospora musae]
MANQVQKEKITKKRRQKRQKSITTLLRLPSNPHDRLQALHVRLGLPRPEIHVIEEKRYRAVIEGGEEEEEVWHTTAKKAKFYAAVQACPGLEEKLVEKVRREEGEGHGAAE